MKARTVVAAVGAILALAWLTKKKPPEPALPGVPPEALGYIWIWAKDYYTIWDGAKWLPARYITSGSALDWLLDVKERNWGKAVTQYKKVGPAWKRV